MKNGPALRVAGVQLWMKQHAISLYALTLTLMLALGGLAPYSFIDVPAGSVGVLWMRFFGGTVIDRIYPEGFHVIFPWDTLKIYDTRMQNDTKTYEAIAANGMMLSVEVAVRFRVNPPGAGLLHKLAGPNYLETLVHPKMASLVLEFVSQRNPEEFYSGRRLEIQTYLNKRARTAFETPQQQFFGDEDGDGIQGDQDGVGVPMIRVEEVMISRVVLPPLVQSAIDRKIEQQQIMQEYDFRLEREEKERQRKR
ncbi:MAG: prohibitin family protein, partial [Ancalomicrobiaceae bacterium]|nr:prohibitin family protein [Ancalomicrobiaceae bacterium]